MKITPKRIENLGSDERTTIMKRSTLDISSVFEHVRGIVNDVRGLGDKALLEASTEFKQDVTTADFVAPLQEIEEAYAKLDPSLLHSLRRAAANIKKFHQAQLERSMWSVEISSGVLAGRITRPIERVGCYIPGGRAAYPSTVLMTVIPARVAGVNEIFITTPPGKDMKINPATLAAAKIAGCNSVFKVGGPWGIAALAYGTETIPQVDKIVGPGNKYVTAAKMIVYGQVDIDSPAGPSEVLILADRSANPAWVALDFISQLEHDPDSAAVVVTTSPELAESLCTTIAGELESAPRKDIIESSLNKHSFVLIAENMEKAIDFANEYAPEHLELIAEDPFSWLSGIRNAGSIFLGPYAPVPVGDYASGTNHVLPTSQYARMFSGLSVDDFLKKPTFQYLTRQGLFSLKDAVINMAEAEGLPNHARAVKARFADQG
ncbi:MAG: histidinol dehydrogenase [Deltaproteobacteria bacterium]|nr:histidinol dehydrogenase [Deltaproteobacteria bacterium]MBW2300897.1 histidinol dehydrogenase [Deltaproteobacteria bacterium]